MMIFIALTAVALAGCAAYAHLRAIGVATSGEERLAMVTGAAVTLLLSPGSPTEFAAELIGSIAIVLGVASIAHLAAVQLGPGRRAGVAG